MKILSFRIRKYRNIEDSGEIRLLDNLTCIVGKNQSGKTALLRALHKFNPHSPEPYDLRRQWPRGQRTSRDSNQVVCEVSFELQPVEVDSLSSIISQPITVDQVVVRKNYAGKFEVHFPQRPDLFPNTLHPNEIDKACEALADPTAEVSPDFATIARDCVAEAKRFAHEGRFQELAGLGAKHVERLRSSMSQSQPHQRLETQFSQSYAGALQAVQKHLGESLTIQARAHQYVITKIPTFIYMDDYKTFRGRADLLALSEKRKAKRISLTEEDETFLMILRLAGLDLDQLIAQGASGDQDTLHDRQLDLQDAATTLTNQVAGRWGQHAYRIQFRTDGQVFFTDIEEVDKNIGMIPLEEQSKGFQWFFSFDLHFMHESGGTFEGCVLLLDEPGLHLHPGGQEDLLQRLDAYSAKNTTVYSTHLPFLVDL